MVAAGIGLLRSKPSLLARKDMQGTIKALALDCLQDTSPESLVRGRAITELFAIVDSSNIAGIGDFLEELHLHLTRGGLPWACHFNDLLALIESNIVKKLQGKKELPFFQLFRLYSVIAMNFFEAELNAASSWGCCARKGAPGERYKGWFCSSCEGHEP
jgi:hypothetical protein